MNNELRKMNAEEFDRIFEILQASFPEDEYRDYSAQKELLNNKYYSVYVFSNDNIIKGFISVWDFEDILFVEHFATDEKYRNSGFGSTILRTLCSMTKNTVCLEVELPENQMTERRIAFYERNGFILNNYEYEQPAYSTEKNPVPLLIMTYGKPVTESQFTAIKNTIYKHVYNK